LARQTISKKRDSENEAFIDRFIIQVKVNKISKDTILKVIEKTNKTTKQNLRKDIS